MTGVLPGCSESGAPFANLSFTLSVLLAAIARYLRFNALVDMQVNYWVSIVQLFTGAA